MDKNYRLLSSYFHENEDLYAQKYEQRFHSEGTFQFSVPVGNSSAFVLMTRSLSLKLAKVSQGLNELNRRTRNVPYLNTLLIDSIFKEIEASNEIEGIHSSRKELQLALQNTSRKKNRFAGQIHQYMKLTTNPGSFPQSSSQIRKLYDELLLEDIDPENRPDGILFRKQPVFVHDGLKTIHIGIMPEEKIIQLLDECIKIMNDQQIPNLIRLAVFHFFFGYIHPLYDGNGRMNRYLSTLFLTHEFSIEAGLQLSLCLRKARKNYYRAFEICEDPLNKGDLTPFVTFFLDAFNTALENEVKVMENRTQLYTAMREKISALEIDKKEQELLSLFAENQVFDLEGLTISELGKRTSLSENTLRKMLKHLSPYLYSYREGKYKHYMLNKQFLHN